MKKDVQFVNILSKYDIIFLYETWTSSKSNVELSGCTAHNFYRQFQHRNARRCSGGLVLYYKDSLKDGISIVKNQYDTIIWIKLGAEVYTYVEYSEDPSSLSSNLYIKTPNYGHLLPKKSLDKL